MQIKTQKHFVEETHLPEKLVRAVVRQMGGWQTFKESASDVTNCGAAGGVSGFICYSETCKFTTQNRVAIAQMAEEQAEDFGMSGAVEMVKGFNCLKDTKTTEGEIARALYGKTRKDDDTSAENALAWYALEEVCRAYTDLTEND
jgi:hypothetical protein